MLKARTEIQMLSIHGKTGRSAHDRSRSAQSSLKKKIRLPRALKEYQTRPKHLSRVKKVIWTPMAAIQRKGLTVSRREPARLGHLAPAALMLPSSSNGTKRAEARARELWVQAHGHLVQATSHRTKMKLRTR